MKKLLILQVFLSVFFNTKSYSQNPRDVLGVPGASGNSYDWYSYLNGLESQEKYNLFKVYSPSQYNLSGTISENAIKLKNMVNNAPLSLGRPYSDVLGLGHDVGGLALRGAQLVTPKITGMILVGTPNRGSALLRDILVAGPNGSSFDTWLANLTTLRKSMGVTTCPDCDKLSNLIKYVDKLQKDKVYLEGAIDEPNNYPNTIGNPNPSLTAVVWGNAGNQTLNDMFGSQGGPENTSSIDLERCAKDLKAIKRKDLDDKDLFNKIQRTTNIINSFSTFLTQLFTVIQGVKDKDGKLQLPGVGAAVTAITGFITQTRNFILEDLKFNKEKDNEERILAICEATSQLMEIEWKLRIAQNKGSLEGVVNPNYNAELCHEWTADCAGEHNWLLKQIACDNKKYYCNQGTLAFILEPTDFVYTKTEQTLANIPLTFEIQANHFREQNWANNKEPMRALFNNIYGPAFKIPKK